MADISKFVEKLREMGENVSAADFEPSNPPNSNTEERIAELESMLETLLRGDTE